MTNPRSAVVPLSLVPFDPRDGEESSPKRVRREALETLWRQAASDPANQRLLPGLRLASMSLDWSWDPANLPPLPRRFRGPRFLVRLFGSRDDRSAAEIRVSGEGDDLDEVSALLNGLGWFGYRVFLVDLSGLVGVKGVQWAGLASTPGRRVIVDALGEAAEYEWRAKPHVLDLQAVEFAPGFDEAEQLLFGRPGALGEPWAELPPEALDEGEPAGVSERVGALIRGALHGQFGDRDQVTFDELLAHLARPSFDASDGFGVPPDRQDVERFLAFPDYRDEGFVGRDDFILRTTPVAVRNLGKPAEGGLTLSAAEIEALVLSSPDPSYMRSLICPRCRSWLVEEKGITASGRRYQCTACGGFFLLEEQ